jgi:prepilin-type N-terminal cleavage/methylation domain-containing protein
MKPFSKSKKRTGFSLVETMVAIALSAVLVMTLIGSYVNQRTINKPQKWIVEMQQKSRAAIGIMGRDIRNAGYGISVPDAHLNEWVSWVTHFDSNPKIIDGGIGGSDTMIVAGAFGAPEAKTVTASLRGVTAISLEAGKGAQFNTNDRKLIYIGGMETARITGISGDVLTLSSHRSQAGTGLKYSYPVGATVELVKVVEYKVVPNPAGYPNRPFLARSTNAVDIYYDWQRLFATGVNNLSVSQVDSDIEFSITSESAMDEQNYDNPDTTDGRRTITMTGRAGIRKFYTP